MRVRVCVFLPSYYNTGEELNSGGSYPLYQNYHKGPNISTDGQFLTHNDIREIVLCFNSSKVLNSILSMCFVVFESCIYLYDLQRFINQFMLISLWPHRSVFASTARIYLRKSQTNELHVVLMSNYCVPLPFTNEVFHTQSTPIRLFLLIFQKTCHKGDLLYITQSP